MIGTLPLTGHSRRAKAMIAEFGIVEFNEILERVLSMAAGRRCAGEGRRSSADCVADLLSAFRFALRPFLTSPAAFDLFGSLRLRE